MARRQTIEWSEDRQYNGQKTDNTMARRQTIQWPEDRQYNDQKTDNTMARRQTIQWPKDRQYNGQKTDNTMARRKVTNNDLQINTQKTKDREQLTSAVNSGLWTGKRFLFH